MRSRLLLVVPLALLALGACRTAPRPPSDPNERIRLKRERLALMRAWIREPASNAEQVLHSHSVARLQEDLQAELGATNIPPEMREMPPAFNADLEAFYREGLAYEFRMLRGFEKFWLDGPPPAGVADLEYGIVDLRETHVLWLKTYRTETGKDYAYTDEHRSFFRGTAEERERQLAEEKDPARRAFLQMSLDWWKAR